MRRTRNRAGAYIDRDPACRPCYQRFAESYMTGPRTQVFLLLNQCPPRPRACLSVFGRRESNRMTDQAEARLIRSAWP